MVELGRPPAGKRTKHRKISTALSTTVRLCIITVALRVPLHAQSDAAAGRPVVQRDIPHNVSCVAGPSVVVGAMSSRAPQTASQTIRAGRGASVGVAVCANSVTLTIGGGSAAAPASPASAAGAASRSQNTSSEASSSARDKKRSRAGPIFDALKRQAALAAGDRSECLDAAAAQARDLEKSLREASDAECL